MWPDRRFIDLVGIDHPIVQAPMAGSCTPALAAAVAEAGGLGSLGVGPRPPDVVRERVAALRSKSNRPFNLNFFAHAAPQGGARALELARASVRQHYKALGLGDPPEGAIEGTEGFAEDRLALLLELRPPVASFHLGVPDDTVIAELSNVGIISGATATTVEEALKVEAAGCDFVVAQGFEAGGHRGAHTDTSSDGGIGTLALIPQVVDQVGVPVVAAGGIVDARGIAAALALGAAGVQLGTAFLRCPEAETDKPRRARLERATDADTIVTSMVTGRANRVAVGSQMRGLDYANGKHMPYPLQYALTGPLINAGGEGFAAHQYGQAASLTREMPASDLVNALVAETKERLAALAASASS